MLNCERELGITLLDGFRGFSSATRVRVLVCTGSGMRTLNRSTIRICKNEECFSYKTESLELEEVKTSQSKQ